MICETEQQAIERAVRFVHQGHKVIMAFGKPMDFAPVFEQAAAILTEQMHKLDEYHGGLSGVSRGAGKEYVIVPRIPFVGIGINRWNGAIVLHPSLAPVLHGRSEQMVFDQVRETHARSWVIE